MARSEYDAKPPTRPVPADAAEHRSLVEVERLASALEDFAVLNLLSYVEAGHETQDGRRYIVRFDNHGNSTDKPEIKEVDL